MRTTALLLLCIAALAATAGRVQGEFVIDLEGVAEPGKGTTEEDAVHVFGDFNVHIPHGHFYDAEYSDVINGSRPDNGTAYLLNDDARGILVSADDGGTFSVQSFDASEWSKDAYGNHSFDAIGYLSGGVSIEQTFTTDTEFSFETFTLNSGFTSLESFRLIDSSGAMAWDNIAIGETQNVPEPTSLALFGIGALGLAADRYRRKQKQPA